MTLTLTFTMQMFLDANVTVMNEFEIKNIVSNLFIEHTIVSKVGDGFLIHLPFIGNEGEPITSFY